MLAVTVLAWGTIGGTPMSSEETMALHRVLKNHDYKSNNVFSVVNYEKVKQRYQDYKDVQKELKMQKNAKTQKERE